MQKTLIALTIAAVAVLTAFAPTGGAHAQQGVPADVLKELAPTGKLRAGINTGNSVLAQKSASGGSTTGSARSVSSWIPSAGTRSGTAP